MWLPCGEARTAESANDWTPRAAVAYGGGAMEVVYERCCGLDVHKTDGGGVPDHAGAGRAAARRRCGRSAR